ncbi:MAG TPA: ankyrin repeat domain-containing protein [bacterium]|jgi:ankyrin repeat protein|nr:ankyrin repeat domain-containing protein [bacterium]
MPQSTQAQNLSPELIREFVIAGHWNLPRVREMLTEHPDLLNVANEWAPGDTETAIQAAAHAGSAHVAEFLLAQGAPLEICTAAMLGRTDTVEQVLRENADLIRARGAHGIPLIAHAALSGDVGLAQMLFERGAREGISMALSNAVSKGHVAMTRWLLESDTPDLTWKNYQGKTALELAVEDKREEIAALLRAHGAEGTTVAREA